LLADSRPLLAGAAALAAAPALGHHVGVLVRDPALRSVLRSALGLGLAVGLFVVLRQVLPGEESEPPASRRVAAPALEGQRELAEVGDPGHFALPSGAPLGISCDEAQRVVSFLHRELSTPGIAPLPQELVEAWAGRLDPHGLWSAAPDSPLQSQLVSSAAEMLSSLQARLPGCPAAGRIALAFESWSSELSRVYQAAFDSSRLRAPLALDEVFRLAAEPIYEDDPVTRPAVDLANELGARLGAFVARFPDETVLADVARARFFPHEQRLLGEMVTLAALRAYVPLVDPHGDFAPFDEEWALYAGDATLDSGSPLWADAIRTPLGARVVDYPAPPLELDDLVLSINGLSLAGASVDQIEQAARSAPLQGMMQLRVLRQGQNELLSLAVPAPELERPESGLELERVPYGADQFVLRVVIPHVGDWLGVDLARLLEHDGDRASALLLDLRGNGGGSLDAAVEALGLFLPGAPLFPLIRRGRVVEVLQAPRPEFSYLGPVAALVDGDTASAAEMLAGGLQAYGRGTLIGARTFGKGCVQEYLDDVSGAGVLRLTTLQFVMPSGKPLQQIGLMPDVVLPLAPPAERESTITRQPITFDGPDVRDRASRPGPTWPRASGAPGPCRDRLVCTAISRLAAARPSAGAGARAARPRAGTR
jgi:carboxyl-terminal processing protease